MCLENPELLYYLPCDPPAPCPIKPQKSRLDSMTLGGHWHSPEASSASRPHLSQPDPPAPGAGLAHPRAQPSAL